VTGVKPLSESCSVSPAGTGLTGGAHRSDRCGSVDSRFVVPLCSRVGRLCVLVPRSSGTPVATWSWPTWVVSRRRVLEAAFVLLEFSSLSRGIFIGSHSLPPSLVRRIGPSMFSSKKSGEKPTQIRGITPRTKARKQAQKHHEKHNSESSIQTRKDSQGLACRPSIHPSRQISHEALMLA
jgi:hypothetical protein